MDERMNGNPYAKEFQQPYIPYGINGYYGQATGQMVAPAPRPMPRLQPNTGDLIPAGTQILAQGGFKPLNRAELMEANRIAAEANFTFDGYQVVRREFFSHRYEPTLTIKGNSITFNNACISKLDEVIYVQVLINPASYTLLIRPCDEGTRDAIRWCIAKEDKRKSREISCEIFTGKLREMLGWEILYRYKLQGTRINANGEQLFLFDLNCPERFLPQTKEGTDGEKKNPRRAIYPEDWRESFGIPVREHALSTQVDLNEGFIQVNTSGMEKAVGEYEQIPMEVVDPKTGEVTVL